jgi:hypothetical protein
MSLNSSSSSSLIICQMINKYTTAITYVCEKNKHYKRINMKRVTSTEQVDLKWRYYQQSALKNTHTVQVNTTLIHMPSEEIVKFYVIGNLGKLSGNGRIILMWVLKK